MENKVLRVTVRLFAAAKELARISETALELPIGAVAGDVLVATVSNYPALKALQPYVRLAVNEAYVDLEWKLRNGDEIAILPPVSGG